MTFPGRVGGTSAGYAPIVGWEIVVWSIQQTRRTVGIRAPAQGNVELCSVGTSKNGGQRRNSTGMLCQMGGLFNDVH